MVQCIGYLAVMYLPVRRFAEIDPIFRGLPVPTKTVVAAKKAIAIKYQGVSYAQRYELLCRRLVLERIYSASCFVMATNSKSSVVTEPAPDLSFARFAAALRGHAVTFLGSQPRNVPR